MLEVIARVRRRVLPYIEKGGAFSLALEFAVSMLFGMAGTDGFEPLGSAAVAGIWIWRGRFVPALIGALTGALIGGRFMAASASAMYIGISLLFYLWKGKVRRMDKLMLLAAAGFLVMPFFCMHSVDTTLIGLASVAFSIASAAICARACRAIDRFMRRKRVRAADGVSALLFSAIVVAALASAFQSGSAAALAATLFALLAAYVWGLLSIAAAVLLSASYMLGGSADALSFACILSLGTLAAALLSRAGRWAAAGGYIAVCTALTYVFSLPFDALAIASAASGAFLIAPAPHMARLQKLAEQKRVTASETALLATRDRLKNAVEIFSGIAAMCAATDTAGAALTKTQLGGICKMMDGITAENGRREKRRYKVSLGAAACSKEGSRETGDSMSMREMDGKLLLLLSDGMGTGALAHKESASAVALFGDLLSVGFGLDEAEDWVNRLLLMRHERDMYATLDALLFDLVSGEAQFVKFGAPPAYVLRGGKVYSVYAEALPMGILYEARPAVHAARLRRGDAVVMMTDGAIDALGRELMPSIIENVGAANTPEDAANALLRAACAHDRLDDMSVIVARIG